MGRWDERHLKSNLFLGCVWMKGLGGEGMEELTFLF